MSQKSFFICISIEDRGLEKEKEPLEQFVEVTPSKTSGNAFLLNIMHLLSSLLVLRSRNWSFNLTLSNFEH